MARFPGVRSQVERPLQSKLGYSSLGTGHSSTNAEIIVISEAMHFSKTMSVCQPIVIFTNSRCDVQRISTPFPISICLFGGKERTRNKYRQGLVSHFPYCILMVVMSRNSYFSLFSLCFLSRIGNVREEAEATSQILD